MTETPSIHVAVVHRRYATMILAGTKTAELRLTRNRIAPFARVYAGERIYFKQSSGPIVATAAVTEVESLEGLTPTKVAELRRRIDHAVRGDERFWADKAACTYATVVHLGEVEPCAFGPDFSDARRANPRAAWLMLPAASDVHPACVDRGWLTASR